MAEVLEYAMNVYAAEFGSAEEVPRSAEMENNQLSSDHAKLFKEMGRRE